MDRESFNKFNADLQERRKMHKQNQEVMQKQRADLENTDREMRVEIEKMREVRRKAAKEARGGSWIAGNYCSWRDMEQSKKCRSGVNHRERKDVPEMWAGRGHG